MSEAGDILRRIVSLLNGAGIPHMIAGSFASTFHGTPRTTQDIDLVIDPTRQSLATFVASLPQSDYYVKTQRSTPSGVAASSTSSTWRPGGKWTSS